MKLKKYAYLYSKPLGNYFKIMIKYLEIYLKTWKNHGNIMEFCHSGKVGTLLKSLYRDKKYLEIHWGNIEESSKNHGILSVWKSRNPDPFILCWIALLYQ